LLEAEPDSEYGIKSHALRNNLTDWVGDPWGANLKREREVHAAALQLMKRSKNSQL
jgi:hypothetical protein